MKSIWDCTYIVIDVETTGSDPVKDRITEIACFVVNGGEIVGDYSSLVNPHKHIPNFIVKMTGISQEMVTKAPEANEVMKEVSKLTSMKDAIFVAHNARFDYSFVQQTMIREGIKFDMPQLCSLKLARKILPLEIKKNVGALASYYNLNILHRHRAFGDAEATAYILIELLEKSYNEYNIKTIDELLDFQDRKNSIPKPNKERFSQLIPYLEDLPNYAGVFYFINKANEIIYIGLARSLKDKLLSFFSSVEVYSKKINTMLEQVVEVRYTECKSELEALILETKEIAKYEPQFNHKLNKYRSFPFIKVNKNKLPIIEKTYSIDNSGDYFGPFTDRFLVDELIEELYHYFPMLKANNDNNKVNQNNLFFSHDTDALVETLKGNNNQFIKMLKDKIDILSKLNDKDKINLINKIIFELTSNNKNNLCSTLLKNNVIILKPISLNEKLLELSFIHNGVLKDILTVGRNQDLEFVEAIILKTYFSDDKTYINIDALDELRIIQSYIYKQKNIVKFIYTHNKGVVEIMSQLKLEVYNYDFDKSIYLM